jgi:hypothetical protein
LYQSQVKRIIEVQRFSGSGFKGSEFKGFGWACDRRSRAGDRGKRSQVSGFRAEKYKC